MSDFGYPEEQESMLDFEQAMAEQEMIMHQRMLEEQMMQPQIGFQDPFQAEVAMSRYRGPKDNYYFNLDKALMISLGFTQEEINILESVVAYYGTVTTQKLTTPPFVLPSHTMISRILYMYNICIGKKEVDTDNPQSIAQHFKKLAQINNEWNTFNCMSIPHRNIRIVPRVAVVAGLPMGNFFVLNSNMYDKMEATYRVEKIAQEWVTIYSERRMKVGVNDRLNNSYSNREWGIPGVLKVEEVGNFDKHKPWKIKIHKKNCRLCNRFLIVITTKKVIPGETEHHGGYELVTDKGQIVYIYARTTDFDTYGNPKDTVPSSNKDTIIFDYGFYRNEIRAKLNKALNAVRVNYNIVYSQKLEGDTIFREIPRYSGLTNIKTGATYMEEYGESPDNSNDMEDTSVLTEADIFDT